LTIPHVRFGLHFDIASTENIISALADFFGEPARIFSSKKYATLHFFLCFFRPSSIKSVVSPNGDLSVFGRQTFLKPARRSTPTSETVESGLHFDIAPTENIISARQTFLASPHAFSAQKSTQPCTFFCVFFIRARSKSIVRRQSPNACPERLFVFARQAFFGEPAGVLSAKKSQGLHFFMCVLRPSSIKSIVGPQSLNACLEGLSVFARRTFLTSPHV